MMKSINFLDHSLRKFQFFRFNYLTMVVSVGALLVFFAGFTVVQKNRLGSFNKQLKAVMSEVEHLNLVQKDHKAKQKDKSVINLTSRVIWSSVLADATKAASRGINLKELHGHWDGDGTLVIKGSVPKREVLDVYQQKLEKLPAITSVRLNSTQDQTRDKAKNLVFELEAKVSP